MGLLTSETLCLEQQEVYERPIYLQNFRCKKPLWIGNDLKTGNIWICVGKALLLKIDKLVKKDRKVCILELNVKYPKEPRKINDELPF